MAALAALGATTQFCTDSEAWNVGLITATRREFTPNENAARNAELRHEIRLHGFGHLNIRGRYVEDYGTARARNVDEHGFLIFGNADDSGDLKGLLRKYGRKFEQDAVVHKGYYRDAQLHALKDFPCFGLRERDTTNLGIFQPKGVGEFYTLMTRLGECGRPVALGDLGVGKVDCLGGRLGGHWRLGVEVFLQQSRTANRL